MKKHFSNSYQGAIDHFVSRAVEFILPCLIPSDGSWCLVPFPSLCLSPGHILFRMPFLIDGANADIMCWTGVCVWAKSARASLFFTAVFNGNLLGSLKEHHFAPFALRHKQFLVF